MLVGLIVKTETNPFFVKMKESALGRTRALCATAMCFPRQDGTLRGRGGLRVLSSRAGKPENTPGLDFHDTGVVLVTYEPVQGIPSISTERALKDCWG